MDDIVAIQLAKKYGANIIISSSALECLLDNQGPTFQRQWELPVKMEENTTTREII